MSNNISLIIITRNRPEMLKRCLLSIVNQTKVPDEVIVVDNASSDDTKKIILSFSKKLPIKYVLEKRIGIPYARNRGIKESHGSIILMTDDDCEADKNWVEGMVNAHKKYPKAWVIIGRSYSKPDEKIYSQYAEFARFFFIRRHIKGKEISLNSFFSKDFNKDLEFFTCDTRNFSIKASYLKKYNLLFDKNFYRCSDIDLGRRISQKGGLIMFCPKIKVYHWERSTLKTLLERRWHTGRGTARINERWKELSHSRIRLPRFNIFIRLFIYCKLLKRLHNLPALTVILLLDKLYSSNGRFYEKRLIYYEKQHLKNL